MILPQSSTNPKSIVSAGHDAGRCDSSVTATGTATRDTCRRRTQSRRRSAFSTKWRCRITTTCSLNVPRCADSPGVFSFLYLLIQVFQGGLLTDLEGRCLRALRRLALHAGLDLSELISHQTVSRSTCSRNEGILSRLQKPLSGAMFMPRSNRPVPELVNPTAPLQSYRTADCAAGAAEGACTALTESCQAVLGASQHCDLRLVTSTPAPACRSGCG